jgi:hypothetical protein
MRHPRPAYQRVAAQALGLEYELEKVTDINAIIDAGVMSTPALAVMARSRANRPVFVGGRDQDSPPQAM